MMTDQSIITIRNLNHHYGDGSLRRQVLFNINLEIKSGEFVIMTGSSGSGKSTLLSLMGCLRTVQEGSLKVLGQELQGATDVIRKHVRRQFGYIFQTSNLVEFLTAEKNLHLALELHPHHNQKQIRHKTQAMLEAVQLGEYGRQYPKQLSGGQRQRIAIACALATTPKLLLADEPTAALDSQSGRTIVELMRDLAQERGSAILMVTHDPRILDIADRIIRVEDGKLGHDYRQEIALALPGLHEQQLERIDFQPDIQTFHPGQYIVRQGDDAKHFYVVMSGTLEVVLEAPSNSQNPDSTDGIPHPVNDDQSHQSKSLKTLKRGDYFGEIGLLRGGKRTASVKVTAAGKAEVMAVDRDTFLALIQQSESTETLVDQRVQQRILLNRLADALPQANLQSILQLLPKIKVLHYGPKSIVIREGDIADVFYVVVDGTLDVIKQTEEGTGIVIRQLNPGDYFGEADLLKDVRRSTTVRVGKEKSAELITLDRTTFETLLNSSAHLEAQMTDAFEKNVGDEIASLLCRRVKGRITKIY